MWHSSLSQYMLCGYGHCRFKEHILLQEGCTTVCSWCQAGNHIAQGFWVLGAVHLLFQESPLTACAVPSVAVLLTECQLAALEINSFHVDSLCGVWRAPDNLLTGLVTSQPALAGLIRCK
jgi:hypothetical protein